MHNGGCEIMFLLYNYNDFKDEFDPKDGTLTIYTREVIDLNQLSWGKSIKEDKKDEKCNNGSTD